MSVRTVSNRRQQTAGWIVLGILAVLALAIIAATNSGNPRWQRVVYFPIDWIMSKFGAHSHTYGSAERANIHSLQTILIAYRGIAGSYPTTEQGLVALVAKPTIEPLPIMWHQVLEGTSAPRDAWGRPYIYRSPGITNPEGYDLFSVGKDGIAGTQDDVIAN